jgi:hypothetical protein
MTYSSRCKESELPGQLVVVARGTIRQALIEVLRWATGRQCHGLVDVGTDGFAVADIRRPSSARELNVRRAGEGVRLAGGKRSPRPTEGRCSP